MKKLKLFALALMALFATGVWADTYYIICNKTNVPLTAGMSNAKAQLLKVEGSTVSATTDISITTNASEGLYYNSTSTTFSNLTNTSNYGTSSGSSRTMSGFKVGDGKSLTIKLGSTIPFSQLDVIYSCGSSDPKKINIAGTEYSTNDKQIHLATITSNVTGDIVISNNSGKDYYAFAILTVPAQKYIVTYTAGAGTGENVVDDEATIVADCPNTFSKEGYKFIGWKDSEDNDVSVGAAVTSNLTLTAQWAQLYSVTYNANGATGTVPAEDEHIAGEKFNVAAQGSIVTPENKAFAGWTYGNGVYAAGAEFTMPEANVEFVAKWIDTYSVTYKANGGIGDDIVANNPATIAGCTFTAPAGKEFNGWKDGNGTRYEVGAAVSTTLVLFAQWKNSPVTLFAWTKGSGAKIETNNTDLNANNMGSMTVGTSVVALILGTNSIDNSNAGYKLGNDDVCIEIQGTEDFVAGDTVKLLAQGGGDGERGLGIAPITAASSADANVTLTNLINDKSNPRTYTVIVTDKQAGEKIRIFRQSGKTMYIKGITVIRPGAKSAVSTVVSISAVTVNNEAISVSDLAKLNADPYTVALTSEYGTAPTIKFTKHTVITYDDDSESSSDVVETIVATEEEGKWQAQLTIDETTYTVTTVKVTASTDATLSGIKIGTDALEGFDAATEVYNIGEFGVYETFTVSATTNDANATKVITADETNKKVTIEVTAEDGTTTKTYTLNYTREAATELVAISGSTTWDWSKAGGKAAEFTDNTLPTRNEWFNFADVLPSPDESFKAASLEGQMQFANRNDNSYAQGYKLRFNTTVPGKVSVQFSNTGTKSVARDIYINGVDTKVGSKSDEKVTVENIAVPAGVVLIEGMEMLETPAANMLRFYKVIFTKSEATSLSNTSDAVKAQKRIENGQLVIEKNGKVFNAMGQTIR